MCTATTSPNTIQQPTFSPSLVSSCITLMSLHSIAARASPTRGTLTNREATGVSPDVENSLTSGGTWADVVFICCASGMVTSCQTNSLVSSTLRTVSFQPFDENARIGGL